MSDISRDEFDRLVERVTSLERRHDAAMDLIGAELFGLRQFIEGQTTGVHNELQQGLSGVTLGLTEHLDERFDSVDARLAGIESGVANLALRTDGTERGVRALLRHFFVEDR